VLCDRFHAASDGITSSETENWQKQKERRDYYQFSYVCHFHANAKGEAWL
jgi:hypothetical protein